MADIDPNLWRQSDSELTTGPSARDSHPEQQDDDAETQALLDREEQWGELVYAQEESDVQRPLLGQRAFLIRGLALLCACSLSIGSH